MAASGRSEGGSVRPAAEAAAVDEALPPYRQQLEQRLEFEHLIAALSTDFINAPAARLDAIIEAALGRIGQLFEVDRAYLFRMRHDTATMSNTHEWVATGISREADNLQEVPFATFPWLLHELLHDRTVAVPDTQALPPGAAAERAEFTREGIRSLALVPFGNSCVPEGFIGFDSVQRQRPWPQQILIGLRLVGQMIFNAFRAREMSESLSQLAFHDALTGLGNRRLLRDRLDQELVRSRRSGASLALILLDLDDFKLVNDSFGHSLGDEVLRAVAARMAATLRASDTIARLGGDEFVVLAQVAAIDHLTQLVDRLFQAMAAPVHAGGMPFTLRVSVGIALYPEDSDDAESLLRQADTAMYSAKAEGKNRFAFFTEEMTRASRASLRLRQELRTALRDGALLPYYQPRVALPSGRVLGFEALVRWQHPRSGLLLPAEFLGLAEQAGLVGEIDLLMLERALQQLATWRIAHPHCRVSVNLSARDLHDDELVARMEQLLHAAGPVAAGLELEITESSLITDTAAAARTLARLRAAAPQVRIAIDDFGSAYSSLAYLSRLPVSTLKVDRCFTADLDGGGQRALAIMQSIIDLARNLELLLVVEGVEREDQALQLARLGCTEAQGFLFAPALPAAAATAALERGAGAFPAPGPSDQDQPATG